MCVVIHEGNDITEREKDMLKEEGVYSGQI